MSRSVIRRAFILALLATAVLATTPAALAGEGPAHWKNEGCHAIDGGRTLCYEDRGLLHEHVSESGHWPYRYRGDTLWTVYAPDGTVEHTERTKVHVSQTGDGPETHREQETFQYRYRDQGYTCRVSSQLVVADGEIRLDHQVNTCGIITWRHEMRSWAITSRRVSSAAASTARSS